MPRQAVDASRTQTSAAVNLLAGGGAGIMEACVCHPLDTCKVRLQLLRKHPAPMMARQGFLETFSRIFRTEGFAGLYKGFDAVVFGMGPKMAVRFTSFEAYKSLLATESGQLNSSAIFTAGLAAGITEAVCVVTPMEVVKIRLQGQRFAPILAHDIPQYRNAFHAATSVAWNEGISALYSGVTLTALRQGTNQAVNFTVYSSLKAYILKSRPQDKNLPSYETATIGLFSGAMGPLCNAPLDTVKTRLQNSPRFDGESSLRRVVSIVASTLRTEGITAFWTGITPRLIRVAPGQAVTFTVYEFLKKQLERQRIGLTATL